MIIHDKTLRRQLKVRSRLKLAVGIPRLSVYRTNNHLWVQIIDDQHGRSLAATSTKALKLTTGTKMEKATAVGKEIAKVALKNKITRVKFDRGPYMYHGRVKALAEAARAGGLKF
ncbi:MAG: 50S ribosomal protein L18 [Candidatus Shapirobacteria bacterium]|nr:50S ribosomal protein L18 [Candidatus Shapirobacteria bacterium]